MFLCNFILNGQLIIIRLIKFWVCVNMRDHVRNKSLHDFTCYPLGCLSSISINKINPLINQHYNTLQGFNYILITSWYTAGQILRVTHALGLSTQNPFVLGTKLSWIRWLDISEESNILFLQISLQPLLILSNSTVLTGIVFPPHSPAAQLRPVRGPSLVSR